MNAVDDGGYETDDILSQALDLAEEAEDDKIFITQNSFRSNEDDDTCVIEDDAVHYLGNNHDNLDDDTCVIEDDAAHFLGNNHDNLDHVNSSGTFNPDDVNFAIDASNIFENEGALSSQPATTQTIAPVNVQESSNRFNFMNETDVQNELAVFVPENTKRKATWARNLYCSWQQAAQQQHFSIPVQRALGKDIINLRDEELNLLLPLFFTSIKRQDGEEYKSETIFSIACGLVKFFEINGKTFPLLSGEQFKSVRNVISNTMRKKVAAGVGLFKKKGRSNSCRNRGLSVEKWIFGK